MEGDTPFWQELILNSVGPLITVAIGGLVVGTFAAYITRSAQDRRANGQLRRELATAGAEILAKIWHAHTSYTANKPDATGDEAVELRKRYQWSWGESLVEAEVMRHRLNAHYLSEDVGDQLAMATEDAEVLREIATGQFLNSDANREGWLKRLPGIVEAADQGEDVEQRVENRFRDHFSAFMDRVLGSELRPMA